MYLKLKAFVDPLTLTVLSLVLSVLGLVASVYSNIPKDETWYGMVRFEMSQAVPIQDLNFKPSNGYWYVGMGNDTEKSAKFTLYKFESGQWKEFTSTTQSSNSIQPPQLVRKNNAIFGWNGTQKIRVIWGSSSNSNLTTKPFLVTDIKEYGRLPLMDIPTKYNKWGWK